MPLSPPPPPLRLSTRPLLGGAVAFGLGIVAARVVSEAGVLGWTAVVLVPALGAALYAWRSRGRIVTLRRFALAGAVLAGAFGLGAARLAAEHTLRPTHIGHLAQAAQAADHARDDRAPITLWATVADVPRASAWSVRFTADADSAARGPEAGRVSGRVQVSLRLGEAAPVYPAVRLGDRVRVTGRLEPPPQRRNPAQMDYGAYLRGQGIHAMLRVEDETGIAFLAPTHHAVDRLALWAQRHIRRAVAHHVPSADSQALLLALLLADRTRIEAETLDAFKSTGLMHLLAVSGLHVGLVGMAVYVVLKPILGRLGVRRRRAEWVRAALTLTVLGAYVVVTGGSVSVVRAFVMAALLIGGRLAERRNDTLNALGAAALVLLFARPGALFEVGFQLSFGAVAAIVTLVPLLVAAVPEAVLRRPGGPFVAGSLATSIAATLGTGPVLLAHFGHLPLGGLLLNLPAIPLTGATLGSGLASVLLADVPGTGAAFGALASVCGEALLWTSRVGAEGLGWATWAAYVDDPLVLAALATAVVMLAVWRRPTARVRLGLGALALLGASSWGAVASGGGAPRLGAVFLDVGQGDATLLNLPRGGHVLIDAGLRSPFVDEGERTVVPHLVRFGIGHLDALVLTHADADHIGGAASVLRAVSVGRVITNGEAGETDLWAEVLAVADSLGVPTGAVGAGDTLDLDPSVRLRVLGAGGASANDASIVLLAEHGRTRWLLTGDAEATGEGALVSRYGALLGADVVKVGHHGSRTSSTPALVDAAGAPAFAVVSVARRNRYGLPDEEPLARWRATGAQTLLTSTEGAVWLESDGEVVRRVAWR